MGLIQGLKTVAMTLLDPRYVAKQTEAAHLREMYRQDGEVVPRRDQWYRVITSNGDLVGAAYSCTCGIEYQFLSLNDMFKEYDCPTCKQHFSLLKTVGYEANKHTPASLPALLVNLPVRPRLAGTKQSPFMDTWAMDRSDVVSYEMADPVTKGL